jgi:DNA-binding MarR family transcriptional regulator
MVKSSEIDGKDILLLLILYQKPGTSIRELANELLLKSVSTVHRRIIILEKYGLISPPPSSKMHRSRTITEKGIDLLKKMGMI